MTVSYSHQSNQLCPSLPRVLPGSAPEKPLSPGKTKMVYRNPQHLPHYYQKSIYFWKANLRGHDDSGVGMSSLQLIYYNKQVCDSSKG